MQETQKVRNTESRLAHDIQQTSWEARYDAAVKKLLANKNVLAQIMKVCVEEYKDCAVQDIAAHYIEGEPEVNRVGVHRDDTNVTHDVGTIAGNYTEDVLEFPQNVILRQQTSLKAPIC